MKKITQLFFVILFSLTLFSNLNLNRPIHKEEGKLSVKYLLQMAQAEGELRDTSDYPPPTMPIP